MAFDSVPIDTPVRSAASFIEQETNKYAYGLPWGTCLTSSHRSGTGGTALMCNQSSSYGSNSATRITERFVSGVGQCRLISPNQDRHLRNLVGTRAISAVSIVVRLTRS